MTERKAPCLRGPPCARLSFHTPETVPMDLSLAGYAIYEMVQVTTGITLYKTCATQAEILEANERLRAQGLSHRFFLEGQYSCPSLHGQAA